MVLPSVFSHTSLWHHYVLSHAISLWLISFVRAIPHDCMCICYVIWQVLNHALNG